jgi:hypothetical protein
MLYNHTLNKDGYTNMYDTDPWHHLSQHKITYEHIKTHLYLLNINNY